MKKTIILILFCICSIAGFAQNELLVKSNAQGLYLEHTVAPKESLYSIGRMYNISPKEIAPFNKIELNTGLEIGQTILIPLTEANFSQSTKKGTPVYYVVGEKEGLYRVSVNNGKVLMADLRKWNNLGSDNINPGQKLIVGFVNATGIENNTAIAATPKTEPAVVEDLKNEETKPVVTKAAPPQKANIETAKQPAISDGKGGYFKNAYEQQSKTAAAVKEETATAGIFKTASGWQDAKYYALMDGVEPGTIVRVINPTNSKAVYAKVLGAMSGISQNKGLNVRISNAAANVLNISDTEKFIVKVNY